MSEGRNQINDAETLNVEEEILQAVYKINANDCDTFLQKLVDVVNRLDQKLEIGLTLTVDGMQLSGTLISGGAFFAQLKERVIKGNPTHGPSLALLFDERAREYEIERYCESDEPPIYIHISQGRWIDMAGNRLPSDSDLLWRGRISAISGFNLGTYGPGR